MAGGNFVYRVLYYIVNEFVVKSLASSPAFQRFAVRTSMRIEDMSNLAARTKVEISEQMKDVSKVFENRNPKKSKLLMKKLPSIFKGDRLLPSSAAAIISSSIIHGGASPPAAAPHPSPTHTPPEVDHLYTILRRFHPNTAKLDIVLRQSGILPTPHLTELVLKRCGDSAKIAYKFFLWAAKQPGYTPSYPVYRKIIKQLSKMKQFGAVWAVLEEMRRENPTMISEEIFIIIIRRFTASHLVKRAVELLDEMPSYGYNPNGNIFRCLLEGLCKKGKVKEAYELMEEMEGRFELGLKEYSAIVHGWCREGKIAEASRVLIEMKRKGIEPDVVVYNMLVNGYVEAGKIHDAYKLLRVMNEMLCPPNTASYTSIIRGYCKNNDMDGAMGVLTEMKTAGCKCDVLTYDTITWGLCRSGKVENGYEVVQHMEEEGKGKGRGYIHILKVYEGRGDVGMCVKLAEEMKRKGYVCDVEVYRRVIGAAMEAGDVEEGCRMWEEMEENKNGVAPNIDMFIMMVHGLIQQGWLEEGAGYFMELVRRGLYSGPQYGMLKVVLNSLIRGGEVEVAKGAWGCAVENGCELNQGCWSIWVNGLLEGGYVKEACLYCVEMLNAGEMPQVDTFAGIMKGLRKMYNRRLAVEITERVREMAAERRISFKMYKRRGERSLVERVGRKIRALRLRKKNMRMMRRRRSCFRKIV